MIVLGFDTATQATAVGLLVDGAAGAAQPGGDGAAERPGGWATGAERRHDPAPGERPGHGAQLLALAHELLDDAGLTFADVDRVAVGLGPGGFTGLRIGVATARALAQAAGAELVGVSTLEALAATARPAPGQGVLAVVDARRGEVFAAGWRDGEPVLGPLAIAPSRLGEVLSASAADGDGGPAGRAGSPAGGAAEGGGGPPERAGSPAGATAEGDGGPAERPGSPAGATAEGDGGPAERPGSPAASAAQGWLAVGDGALRFRGDLEGAGCLVPEDGSARHGVSALAVCRLARQARGGTARDLVVPDYLRKPDAVPTKP